MCSGGEDRHKQDVLKVESWWAGRQEGSQELSCGVKRQRGQGRRPGRTRGLRGGGWRQTRLAGGEQRRSGKPGGRLVPGAGSRVWPRSIRPQSVVLQQLLQCHPLAPPPVAAGNGSEEAPPVKLPPQQAQLQPRREDLQPQGPHPERPWPALPKPGSHRRPRAGRAQ